MEELPPLPISLYVVQIDKGISDLSFLVLKSSMRAYSRSSLEDAVSFVIPLGGVEEQPERMMRVFRISKIRHIYLTFDI